MVVYYEDKSIPLSYLAYFLNLRKPAFPSSSVRLAVGKNKEKRRGGTGMYQIRKLVKHERENMVSDVLVSFLLVLCHYHVENCISSRYE